MQEPPIDEHPVGGVWSNHEAVEAGEEGGACGRDRRAGAARHPGGSPPGVDDALRDRGVCREEAATRRIAPRELGGARERLERGGQAGRVPARVRGELHAEPIGLTLLLLAVRRQHDASGKRACSGDDPAEIRAHDAERGRRHAEQQRERSRGRRAAHVVVGDDVADLMSRHSDQLVLAVQEGEESAAHVDVATGQGKGVELVVVEKAEGPVAVLRGGAADQPCAHVADVAGEAGILDQSCRALDFAGRLTAQRTLALAGHHAAAGRRTGAGDAADRRERRERGESATAVAPSDPGRPADHRVPAAAACRLRSSRAAVMAPSSVPSPAPTSEPR